MWLFQFITDISFRWEYLMWRIFALLRCIGIWAKLRIYRVPPDPVKSYCRVFGYLWQAFILMWILFSNNDLKVYQMNSLCASSDVRLLESMVDIKFQTFGIFKGIWTPQENRTINPTNFEIFRVGKHNKEISLIKPHRNYDISLSHLWHWSY